MYKWPNSARLAISIVVNVEEGAEMNILDGDPRPEPVDEMSVVLRSPSRNLGNESNYSYGINEGLGRIVDLLDAYKFPATWTVASSALSKHPRVAQMLSSRPGDEVASHGQRWVHQYRMNPEDETEFIRSSVVEIENRTGQRPSGYLSRYLPSENTRDILIREGFLYHMDDYSRDEPFWATTAAGRIVVVPYSIDTNDMKMWMNPALTPRAWSDYALATFERLFIEGSLRPRMMSLGLHLRIVGRPGRIGELERLFDHWSKCDGVWIATRKDIAEHFRLAAPHEAHG